MTATKERHHFVTGGMIGTAAAATLLVVAALKAQRPRVVDPPAIAPDAIAPVPTADARVPSTTKGGLLGRIDLFQQHRTALAFPVAVLRKFSDDRAGRLAALMAYYSFFSVFPALLALVTILGFVLEGHPAWRDNIADSALAQFPIIGDSIGDAVRHPLTGSPLPLIIGILGAVWAGLAAMQAAQDAQNEVWDVPRSKYPNYLRKHVRSLAMLVLIGVLLIISTGVGQLAGLVVHGIGLGVLVIVASLLFNVVVFAVAFRVLTVAHVTWQQVFPGACVGAVAYTVLQFVGRYYVERSLQGATNTYGTFAIVIGLISWIFLIAQMVMIAAEVNVVAAKRLWPRSLFGEPATVSDRRSVAAQAEAEQIHAIEHVDVEFAVPAGSSDGRATVEVLRAEGPQHWVPQRSEPTAGPTA